MHLEEGCIFLRRERQMLKYFDSSYVGTVDMENCGYLRRYGQCG